MEDKPVGKLQHGAAAGWAGPLSEIQEDLVLRRQRRHLFPRAALVGLLAGLTAALFRAILWGADVLRNTLLAWSHQFSWWGWVFPVLFSMIATALAFMLVIRFAPETSGSGIPHLEAVLHRLRTLQWARVLPVKFLSGVLAIGGGLVLGREGPTVQMGGAVGDAVANWLRVPSREQRDLIAAGAGAGLAAAFNAPLAGVMFVLEEIQRDFHPFVFGATFLASAIADIVVRFFSGAFPVFDVPNYPSPPMASLPVFVLLGLLAGMFGVLFNRGLLRTLDLFDRVQGRWRLILVASVGAIVGMAGWFSPAAIDGGHSLVESVVAGKLALAAIPLLFVVRFFLSMFSYGTGTAGGIFLPLLTLGALLGLALGQIAHHCAPAIVPEAEVFAVVGMAAYFASVVRAPLTGIVLIVEMTGDYQLMLPLLVCCFCAYGVAEWMKDLPIYEALLERDLLRDEPHVSIREPMIVDLVVERGAPFVGQRLRTLGLQPGCLLVRCVEEGREFVPTAETRLEEHMRITAIISPEASDCISVLRRGCKGRNGAPS